MRNPKWIQNNNFIKIHLPFHRYYIHFSFESMTQFCNLNGQLHLITKNFPIGLSCQLFNFDYEAMGNEHSHLPVLIFNIKNAVRQKNNK